jgi:hypothetical protein
MARTAFRKGLSLESKIARGQSISDTRVNGECCHLAFLIVSRAVSAAVARSSTSAA